MQLNGLNAKHGVGDKKGGTIRIRYEEGGDPSDTRSDLLATISSSGEIQSAGSDEGDETGEDKRLGEFGWLWHKSELKRSFYCRHPCPIDRVPVFMRRMPVDFHFFWYYVDEAHHMQPIWTADLDEMAMEAAYGHQQNARNETESEVQTMTNGLRIPEFYHQPDPSKQPHSPSHAHLYRDVER